MPNEIGFKESELREKTVEFLHTLSRAEIVFIAMSWEGHNGVNWETTTTQDLILLIVDALEL